MTYKIPANAKIISIDDSFVLQKSKYTELEGLKISTDLGNILLLIDNRGQCCEQFGGNFLETPDDITKFIGATIIEVSDTNDKELNGYEYSNETQLKIVTTKGTLQYAVYNEHNGYYSHSTFTQVFTNQEEGSL